MAVLVIGVDRELGPALISRLRGELDQVRLIEEDAGLAERWRRLGAFVAAGSPRDVDLVERAAEGVRTVVVAAKDEPETSAIVGAVLQGASHAAVERVILCGGRPSARARALVEASGMDHVVLVTARRLARSLPLTVARTPVDAVADAVNAADDLAGNPRLELDLTRPKSWRSLGLQPP